MSEPVAYDERIIIVSKCRKLNTAKNDIMFYTEIKSQPVKGKKVLVTGGAGFIGSNLVRTLSKDNDVVVLDNLHTGRKENIEGAIADGTEFIKGDAKDIKSLKGDFDQVFHLGIYSASPMYRENPNLVGEVVHGMINILEYCKESKIPLVFASTSSIYNGIEPPHREDVIPGVTDFYTEARIACERLGKLYANLYDVNVSAMRFFSVYGYNDIGKGKYANLVTQFMVSLINGEQPIIYGEGEQRRDFVFVTDVVDALLKASSSKGFNVYNVGTGKNYSLNEAMERLKKITGNKIEPKYIRMPVKNYVMTTLADPSKAKKEIGFEAKVNLDKGISLLYSSILPKE
jgi:UDP-glucose 4-epimerase